MESLESSQGRPHGNESWASKGHTLTTFVVAKITKALVAIKSVELARLNKKLKENLYGEIKILKTLRHPHIVALHDCVETPSHINLVMEYCELGDLSLFIKKRDKLVTYPATHDMARKYPNPPNSGLNEVVVRHFLKQLASALEFLRKSNFVHRDVKPQNLLLLPSLDYRKAHMASQPIMSASHDSLVPVAGVSSLPMLKLADFGFARVLPSTSLAETLCGSPLYMAPEILRYERYDAKADLWSVGTVLYEMVTGRPPFRASNHVELLRKIENADDVIKFPRETVVSADMKALIRALLKRSPIGRLTFESFFDHPVVKGPIPGLVEDDVPKPERTDLRRTVKPEVPEHQPRRYSIRRYGTDQDGVPQETGPSSPRERPVRSSPLASPVEQKNYDNFPERPHRYSQSPRAEGLGIHRPQSRTAQVTTTERPHRTSNASVNRPQHGAGSPGGSVADEAARKSKDLAEEREKAAQDVAFERDYVVVEKKHVEVNAFADEMAANPRLAALNPGQLSPKSGQMIRRPTPHGASTSPVGTPSSPTAIQIARNGRDRPDHVRNGSYDKAASGSPGSTTSYISKAIQDASLRLFGIKYNPSLAGKGNSPPQLYGAFPAYSTPATPLGLIGDSRGTAPVDEDTRVVQLIEDYATRSDVVYGFAEVKYKQLVPLAPSMDHGLGGVPADRVSGDEADEGLTPEAIATLSEEALVLYVKALSLLAKAMECAKYWWGRKGRPSGGDSTAANQVSLSSNPAVAVRINSAVQWTRGRFNEVLEKAEVVRLKLIDAQRQLPENHPMHPGNNQASGQDSALTMASGASTADGVRLTPGLSAEKLMYERAIEMSKTAAINEITNDDLQGCETYYVTAIRMLEAVLDNDETVARGSKKDGRFEDAGSEIDIQDQQSVQRSAYFIYSHFFLNFICPAVAACSVELSRCDAEADSLCSDTTDYDQTEPRPQEDSDHQRIADEPGPPAQAERRRDAAERTLAHVQLGDAAEERAFPYGQIVTEAVY